MEALNTPAYLIPPLAAAILCGLLDVIALRAGVRNPTYRIFSLFLLALTLWAVLIYLMRVSPDTAHAMRWERLVLPVTLMSTPAFFVFAKSYARRPMGTLSTSITLVYVATAIGLALSGRLLESMTLESYGYVPTLAPAFYVLALGGYLLMAAGVYNLYRAYRDSDVYVERNRLLYIMIATSFPVLGTVLDLLPQPYPGAIFGSFLFGAVTTVAMLRYHLLDVRVVVKKGLSYLAISALIAVPYVVVISIVSLGLNRDQIRPDVYILILVVLALLLQPLWSRLQSAVDRTFFRQRQDLFHTLEEFTGRTRSIAELEKPASDLVDIIRTAVRADGVALLLPSDSGDFSSIASSGRESLATLRLNRQTPLTVWMEKQHAPLEMRHLELDAHLQAVSDKEKESMRHAGARLLVPLRMRERLSGILVLGPKVSEAPYSQDEMRLLSMVASQTAVLLDDTRLYQSVTAQLEEGRNRLEAFQKSADRLALGEDADRSVQELIDTARTLIGARYGTLAVWGAKNEMRRSFVSGFAAQGHEPLGRASEGVRGVSRESAGSGTLAASLDALAPAAALGAARTPRTRLIAPIVRKGRSLGTIYLVEKENASEFTSDDERILNLFGVLAAVLLENINLYQEVVLERGSLAAIQSSMAEGLVVLNAEGKINYLNPAAIELLGLTGVDSLGRDFAQLLGPRTADTPLLKKLTDGRSGTSSGDAVTELRLTLPVARELAVTTFPIPGVQNEMLTGLLLRDVSRERELERRRDAFVATASHELRTPMTTIMGYSELFLTRKVPEAVQKEGLQRIYKEGQRLTAIVDDLLNVSRIQSGRLHLEVTRAVLRDIVDEAVAMIKPTAEGHTFVVNVDRGMPLVLADRDKLTQVLINLVTNAVKYSPAGGPVTIAAMSQAPDGRIVVSVTDTGIGIAPEDRERLFTTFNRIRRPETATIRGSGLGLFIVKGLVELMGGQVWLESEMNHGSTFYFSVPGEATVERGGVLAVPGRS